MLRISRIRDQNSALTLKLEGKLLEPWIAELLNACTPTQDLAGRQCLDLSELTYADKAGTLALQGLIGRGYAVSACSGYIAELLHLEIS
jgi:hypothetical protein